MLILLRQGFGATRSETFSTSDKIRTLDETAPTNDLIHRVSDPGYNVIGHLFSPKLAMAGFLASTTMARTAKSLSPEVEFRTGSFLT